MACSIANNLQFWTSLTRDAWVFKTVAGYKIPFEEIPHQNNARKEISFSPQESAIISAELDKFVHTGVIERATYSDGQYVSNIFIRPKKDGKYRLILNLKSLNSGVTKQKSMQHSSSCQTCRMAIAKVHLDASPDGTG